MATIKGKWVWNSDGLPAAKITSNITASVNFTSNNEVFTSLQFKTGTKGNIFYGSTTAFTYDGGGTYVLQNVAYKTVDFGETEQTVDDTWYAIFTANAAPQITIKAGTYIFKSTLNTASQGVEQALLFVDGAGAEWHSIAYMGSEAVMVLAYVNNNDEGSTIVYTTGDPSRPTGWHDQAYRTIILATDQEVTEEFYTWFDNHIVKQGENEVTIVYNEMIIASLVSGKKAILDCAGHKMADNVVITFPVMSGEVIEEWDFSYTVSDPISLISFSIAGTTYQAEEGMTWSEWTNSEYNTSNFVEETDRVYNSSGAIAYENKTQVKPSEVIVGGTAYAFYQHTSG